jgi:hypothetical protein
MSGLTTTGRTLIQLMNCAPRGPKSEGHFALWLTVRVIEDLSLEPPPGERILRRRVSSLERRLSSLALPSQLRRGLAGALETLREGSRAMVPVLLNQLVAPTKEAIGPEAADALSKGARKRREERGERK